MTRVHTNSLMLAYDEFGAADGEPLLLISGLGTQRTRWAPALCEQLAAQGFRVIRFDNRDAGESTHLTHESVPDFAMLGQALAAGRVPSVPYTLHDLVADTVGLLDALGIARAHVVGRSMGGMVALLMAATHPQRVWSLASLMSSSGNPALPGATPDVMALMMTPAPHPAEDEDGFATQALAFARRIASPGFPFDEAAQRELIAADARRAYNPAGFARQLAAMAATGDLRPHLAGITAPTLIVHGLSDPLIPPACGRDCAASILGAEFLGLEEVGHDLPTARVGVVAQAITRNARRVLPPAA